MNNIHALGTFSILSGIVIFPIWLISFGLWHIKMSKRNNYG